MQNLKFLALLVQILTWSAGGLFLSSHKSNVHEKAHEE